jgi:zona occludens toxin
VIELLTGTPGAGKSYAAVRRIVDELEAGKVVVTNIPLAADAAERFAGANGLRRLIPGRRARVASSYRERVLVVDDLEDLMRVRVTGTKEGRAVAVLDEAHEWMNARSWTAGDREAIVRWFAKHRHLGFDVVLITQDEKNLDRQVRDLYEYLSRVKNLRRFRLAGVPVFPFNCFVVITSWHDAQKSVVRRRVFGLNRRVAGCYATHSHRVDQEEEANLIWMPSVPAERQLTQGPGPVAEGEPDELVDGELVAQDADELVEDYAAAANR